MVDHHRAAGRQAHFASEGRFDLAFDLESGKQRSGIAITLQLAQVVRHHLLQEFTSVLEHLFRIDQDLADVVAHVIAQCTNDDVGFLVNQERRLARDRRGSDRFPQLHQVIQIPLQVFRLAADTRGANDQAHRVGDFKLAQRIMDQLAILAGDLAGDAAGARTVRHQHQVASGEADEGRQCRTLGAALFLLDLDDDFKAALHCILDVDLLSCIQRFGRAFGEVFPGNFLERQETVAFRAELDEAGLETGLDARDSTFVDVGLLLFLGWNLDVEVDKILAIGDGNSQLFGLSCVDQHSFHGR